MEDDNPAADDMGFLFDDFTVSGYSEVVWSTVDDRLVTASMSTGEKAEGTYHYRVRAHRDDRWWGWSNVHVMTMAHPTVIESSTPTELPNGFRLSQNYPNPFNPSTTISYDLAANKHVHLSVYALNGQVLRTLVDADRSAGTHSVAWDGRDDRGGVVASGLYLYRMEADGTGAVRKMLLLR